MDSLEQLKQEVAAFNKERDWDQFHSAANLAKSISIEAGELLECFQWDEEHFDRAAVEEELADVVNYCLQMSNVMGINLKKIVEDKMAITAKKYPVAKCKGRSTKYNKL
jgi:dCTP diphosphatase